MWPDLRCAGDPEVFGAALPADDAPAQSAPKKGAGPRVDVESAQRKLAALPHRLLAHVQADGYPAIVPVGIGAPGGRRAGVYAPHTESGFKAPANKTLLLLGNGYLARRGLKRARRAAAERRA